jgi:molybdopterin converting factor small subunit
MTIHLFAVLKEYFPAKIIILSTEFHTVQDVKHYLMTVNPEAKNILEACRFAVANKIVDTNFSITEEAEIAIIPPSSGG